MSQKMNTKKVIFNAAALAQQYINLENDAITQGKEDTAYWRSMFNLEFHNTRKGNQGTQWVSVKVTDVRNITGPLAVRINNELIIGQIMPASEAGLAEFVAKNPNAKYATVRTKKAAFSVQEWAAPVKTSDDGINILTDSDGNPILPDDDKRSAYFKLTRAVNKAFVYEVNERIERGKSLLTLTSSMKKSDKSVTVDAVIDNFITSNGPRRPGDMILSTETVNNLRKFFPNQKDTDKLTKGAIITSNTKVIELNQEYISSQATKNAGLKLPNPITRVSLNFDSVTGVAQTAFFDKGAPYVADGRQKYEIGRVDGEPVNMENVHKFVLSRSRIDGIINMDAVCFSNMGISVPVKAEVAVIDRPAARGVSLDDVYDDDEAPVANVVPVAVNNKAVVAAVNEENYDDLLGELGGN